MNFLELKKHLSQKKFSKVYNVFGEDQKLIDIVIKQFEDIIVDFKDINIIHVDKNVVNKEEILDVVPMCSLYKLIVFNDSEFKDEKMLNIMKNYLKNPLEYNIILIVGEVKFSSNMQKIICDRLPNDILKAYISRECNILNTRISNKAMEKLIEFCNGFLEKISNELEKLIFYKFQSEIDEKDVELVVTPHFEYKIYELCDNIIKRNKDQACHIFFDMLRNSFDPINIFAIIYNYFRLLLYVKLNKDKTKICNILNIKKGRIGFLEQSTKTYSTKELFYIIKLMFYADNEIKTNKVVAKSIIEDVFFRIIEI